MVHKEPRVTLPDSCPSRSRKLNCVSVWGIVKVDQGARCIINRSVWEVTATSAQNPELVAMKVHWMAHLDDQN